MYLLSVIQFSILHLLTSIVINLIIAVIANTTFTFTSIKLSTHVLYPLNYSCFIIFKTSCLSLTYKQTIINFLLSLTACLFQEEKKKKLATRGVVASMAVVPPPPFFFLLSFFSFFYLFKGFSSSFSMLHFG